MKRYFSSEDFITFLVCLENNKMTPLFTESAEDGSVDKHNFMKLKFSGNEIILFDHPSCTTGIIQDTPVAPWEDYAKELYEDLTIDNEYKVFIET